MLFCFLFVLLTYTWFYCFHGESNILLIDYAFFRIICTTRNRIHILIHAALYPLYVIVSSVFQVPDAAMVEDSSNFRRPNETSSEASSSGNCLVTVRL